jgi:NAD(P)-dependent dehydrogenase (short-subunit alcohol dehydrogenase family)
MSNYVLVTGASSGIGRSICIKLAEKGFSCVLNGRNLKELQYTLSLLKGENHLIFGGDLISDDFQDFLSKEIPLLLGIIHSAGVIKLAPVRFIKKIDFEKIMNVNFFSPFFLTQRLLNQRKIIDNGSIVFISSISGSIIGSKGNLMYSASKSAINGIVKTLALELAEKKIRVNSLCAGMVNTEMWAKGSTSVSDNQLATNSNLYPLGYGEPEYIASIASFLISRDSIWMTGSSIVVDGGFTIQ